VRWQCPTSGAAGRTTPPTTSPGIVPRRRSLLLDVARVDTGSLIPPDLERQDQGQRDILVGIGGNSGVEDPPSPSEAFADFHAHSRSLRTPALRSFRPQVYVLSETARSRIRLRAIWCKACPSDVEMLPGKKLGGARADARLT